jgi:penicillin-binding protein 1A
MSRLNHNLDKLSQILIFIEDRDFRNHKGFSPKAIIRALLGIVGRKRRSGGSTITQQLARTLFIIDLHKIVRRKIVEICLAIWLESKLSKEEIIEIYLCSVRFGHGTYGLHAALQYWFGQNWNLIPKNAMTFFLIERISNVYKFIYVGKVRNSIAQLIDKKLLSKEDEKNIYSIYCQMIGQMNLKPDNNQDFRKWGEALS